jgi:hypothetical protein
MIVSNQSHPDALTRKPMTNERAAEFLKHPIAMQIGYLPERPQEAINRATPLIELDADFQQDITRLSDIVLERLGG